MPMTVHCPKCGCDVIKERNVAYANLEVLDWEWDEKAEEVRPANYDTDVSADWEACDGPNIYVCANCDWEGGTDDLAVRGSATSLANLDTQITRESTYDADLREAIRLYDAQVVRSDFPENEYEKARADRLNDAWVEGITVQEWVDRAIFGVG